MLPKKLTTNLRILIKTKKYKNKEHVLLKMHSCVYYSHAASFTFRKRNCGEMFTSAKLQSFSMTDGVKRSREWRFETELIIYS